MKISTDSIGLSDVFDKSISVDKKVQSLYLSVISCGLGGFIAIIAFT